MLIGSLVLAIFLVIALVILSLRQEDKRKETLADLIAARDKIQQLEKEVDALEITLTNQRENSNSLVQQSFELFSIPFLNVRNSFVTDVAAWLKRYRVKSYDKVHPAHGVAFKEILTMYVIYNAQHNHNYVLDSGDTDYLNNIAPQLLEEFGKALINPASAVDHEVASIPLVRALPEFTAGDFITQLRMLITTTPSA